MRTGRPRMKTTLVDVLLERSEFEDRGYETPCLIWKGYIGTRGYGVHGMPACIDPRRRTWLVHRASWMAFKGPITSGLLVCHKCDQTACIEPSHLFLGTQKDNMRDAMVKGRRTFDWNRGEKHPDHKLTDAQVAEIRASNDLQKNLAAKFGVNPAYISELKSGRKRRILTNVNG